MTRHHQSEEVRPVELVAGWILCDRAQRRTP
jgi:hypothetical protein